MNAETDDPTGPNRLAWLDAGRIVFAVCVVAWHSHALGQAAVFTPPTDGVSPIDFRSAVYFNVLLLAVPYFLVVAVFLYARARALGHATFQARMRRVGVLAIFWVGLYTLIHGVGAVDLSRAPEFVMTGGHSIFYFFVELGLLTCLAEFILRSKRLRELDALCVGLALSIGLLLCRIPISTLLPAGARGDALAYWSPLGFLPYAWAGVLVERISREKRLDWRSGVLGLASYVGIAIAEWAVLPRGSSFATDQTLLPPYARPSLVLGACLILLAAAQARRTLPTLVRRLAELTLAIYAIHIFVLEHFSDLLPRVNDEIGGEPFLRFMMVLALTGICAYAVKRETIV